MIEVYKIVSGKYDTKVSGFIKMWEDRGNCKKIFKQRARLDLRKYSFNIRIVKTWNSLPDEVVCAKTLNTFKNRLDKFWENQEVLYDNYKADIAITQSRESYISDDNDTESNIEDP